MQFYKVNRMLIWSLDIGLPQSPFLVDVTNMTFSPPRFKSNFKDLRTGGDQACSQMQLQHKNNQLIQKFHNLISYTRGSMILPIQMTHEGGHHITACSNQLPVNSVLHSLCCSFCFCFSLCFLFCLCAGNFQVHWQRLYAGNQLQLIGVD